MFISSLIITISALSSGLIKSTVFPNIEGDNILINLKFQAGSSEEKTNKWIDFIEKKIIDKNKEISSKYNNNISLIKDIEKTIGNTQTADQWTPSTSQSSEKGSLNIIIIPSEERSIGTSEIANFSKKLLVKYQLQNRLLLILHPHLERQLVLLFFLMIMMNYLMQLVD